MRLWSVEGNRQRLDGGAMFGNAPRAMWEKWIAPDDENRIPLACRCLLVEGPRRPQRPVRDRHRRVLRAEAARALRRGRSRGTCCSIRWPTRGFDARGHRRRRAVAPALRSRRRPARRVARRTSRRGCCFRTRRIVVGDGVLAARAAPASARSRVVHPGVAEPLLERAAGSSSSTGARSRDARQQVRFQY